MKSKAKPIGYALRDFVITGFVKVSQIKSQSTVHVLPVAKKIFVRGPSDLAAKHDKYFLQDSKYK